MPETAPTATAPAPSATPASQPSRPPTRLRLGLQRLPAGQHQLVRVQRVAEAVCHPGKHRCHRLPSAKLSLQPGGQAVSSSGRQATGAVRCRAAAASTGQPPGCSPYLQADALREPHFECGMGGRRPAGPAAQPLPHRARHQHLPQKRRAGRRWWHGIAQRACVLAALPSRQGTGPDEARQQSSDPIQHARAALPGQATAWRGDREAAVCVPGPAPAAVMPT